MELLKNLNMDGFQRPFATGSKPGPDAVDHYLEEKGFYRKHVARDASSLFRVVSEQVFALSTPKAHSISMLIFN